ncbi:MAG TPA: hypothetical protein VLB44_10315 [Kofleriaceae bacterium]|nr:hypothetical protein [Kofleriaceae bacterium]
MKRLAIPALLVLSLGVSGCAHAQHPDTTPHHTARDVALTAIVIGAIVLTTALVPCAQCNDTFIGPSTGSQR